MDPKVDTPSLVLAMRQACVALGVTMDMTGGAPRSASLRCLDRSALTSAVAALYKVGVQSVHMGDPCYG
jgi:hypothetical protein